MLMCSITMLVAQTRVVRGVVTSSEDGEPVIGASVIVVGTALGAATDLDGKFEIKDVPADAKKLNISYIGFTTKQVNITNKLINVVLESEMDDLDEVVVIGYGTAKAKSLTAAIASVKGDEIKDMPGSSVDGMLQGRAAGVLISTSGSGMGEAPIINIRGVSSITSSTTPLYVVDGMVINTDNISSYTATNPLSDINPADIKSIDILKDAAATAMYGSRASAGVVLITTKGGQSGKSKLSYDYAFNMNMPTNFVEVMNAEQYTEIKTLGRVNSGYETADGEHMYNTMKDSKGKLVDTNWKDLLFRTGYAHNHNVNISGGNDKSQYYIGAGIMKQDGITVGDSYQRFSFKGNGNIKFNKWMKLGMNTTYTNSTVNVVDGARGGGVNAINGLPRMAQVLPPNVPAYNEDGTPFVRGGHYLGSGNNTQSFAFYNPMTYINSQKSTSDNNRIIGSAYLEYKPVKGLTLKSQYGIDWSFMQNGNIQSPLGGDGFNAGGSSNFRGTNRKIWTWTTTADYNISVKRHTFDILGGYETTDTKQSSTNRSATGLLDKDMIFPEASFGTYTGSGSRNEASMISYISRFTYDWANRYYFTANFRRDGLSRLGRKWGNFWGLSGAWRISDEKFMKPAKSWMNDLKLKASYGVVGNANVGWYAALSTYSLAYFNGDGSYYATSYNDPNLGWEQSGTWDAGFTASFLSSRITLDFDWYYTKTKDLILAAPVSYSTGIYDSSNGAAINTNLGQMMNSGVEIGITALAYQNGKFTWNTGFNISFMKNEVTKLVDDILPGSGAAVKANITTEGKSISQLYLYPSCGVDPQSGRRIVELEDGSKAAIVFYRGATTLYEFDEANKTITDKKRSTSEWKQVVAGRTTPTYSGGWTNNFKYGQWDASLFFQFSGGNKIFNGNKANEADQRFFNNSKHYYDTVWRKPGDKSDYAKAEYNDNVSNGGAYPFTDFLENGDYLRLKTLSLGYSLNTKKWNKNYGVQSIRFYAQATNLFCITGYTGSDPEMSSLATAGTASANLSRGIDKNTTPLTKTITFGFNVQF